MNVDRLMHEAVSLPGHGNTNEECTTSLWGWSVSQERASVGAGKCFITKQDFCFVICGDKELVMFIVSSVYKHEIIVYKNFFWNYEDVYLPDFTYLFNHILNNLSSKCI